MAELDALVAGDMTVVWYSSLPFDMLLYIFRLSPFYFCDDFWMNANACIFSVVTYLAFSMSVDSSVSHMINEPFVILISDINVPDSC